MPGKKSSKKAGEAGGTGAAAAAESAAAAPAKAPAKEITKEDVDAKEAEFNRRKDELQKRRETLRAQIELKSSELQVARAKFQGAKDVQQALREDLKAAKARKDAVLEGVKGHRSKMKSLIEDMKSTTAGMRYRSVEAIDRRLEELEDQERFGSMSAREETAVLKERTDLKVQRMALERVSGKQKRLDTLKAQIDGKSKAASEQLDGMREEMQAKYEKVEQQSKVVDGHRAAMDEIYHARKALEAKRDAVRKELDTVYQENRAFKDTYHQAVRDAQHAKWLVRQAERDEQARKRRAEDERYRLQEKRRYEEDAHRQAAYDPAAARVAAVEALIDEIRQLAPEAARAHDEERGIKTEESVPLALRKHASTGSQASGGGAGGSSPVPLPEGASKAKAVERTQDAGLFGALAGAAGAGSKGKKGKAARKAAKAARKAAKGGPASSGLILPSVMSLSEESREQLTRLKVDPPMSTTKEDALPVLKQLEEALEEVKKQPSESYASRFARALGLKPGSKLTTVFGPGKIRSVRTSDGMLEVELQGFTATLFCTTEEASEVMSKARFAERQRRRRAEREARGEGLPRGRGRGRGRRGDGEGGAAAAGGAPRGRGRGRGRRGDRDDGKGASGGAPRGGAAGANATGGAAGARRGGDREGASKKAVRPPPGLGAPTAGAQESKEADPGAEGEAAAAAAEEEEKVGITDSKVVRAGKVAGDISPAAFPTLGGTGGKRAGGAWAAGGQ